jgi:AAA15 family ATPase/GTPase
MLIEFKVSNYRSIREEQTFSLVASNSDKELPSCVIECDLPSLSGVKFLKGAAIYGANASGKSNVVQAIRFLAEFVKGSVTKLKPGDSTGAEPFKLDRTSASEPSKFEITFVADGVRYLFGLSVTEQRVVEEYLVAYPKGAPQRWYHRAFNEETNTYTWAKSSTAFKHDKDLQEKTRDNSLFLSVGPQFNHPQLTQVFNWFETNLHFIQLADEVLTPEATAKLITQPSHHDRLLNLLRSADIGITDAKIQEKDAFSLAELRQKVSPDLLPEMESLITAIESFNAKAKAKFSPDKVAEPVKRMEINLTHKAEGIDPVSLDYEEEESAGTQRFFSLIGPWTDILDNGYTAFIDEIETSLHPILVRELLALLFSDKGNPKGAQIVFTTHNPILLDSTLLRRDQIWFTEKSPAGATHLYPLTDYKPRKDEALAKGYLAGRYGAIPYLPDGLKL